MATFQVENSASCSLKSPNVFECGRRPGAFHTDRNAHPRWDTGIYWKCFKKKTSDSSLFRAEFCAEPKKLLFWREVVQES